jgi:2-amino-4-hydroxy-6-hydroxymethyldihydropteridine diphosphokinase
MMKRTAYIALGSNLGRRGWVLRRAMDMLRQADGITLKRVSELIETDPVGGPAGQGKYLNGAAEVETTLGPAELLAALQEIEAKLGRDRQDGEKHGPRTCDLDIVLMEDVEIKTPTLTIPHPRMHERRFVLEPLAQIAPTARHPGMCRTVAQLLADLEAEA